MNIDEKKIEAAVTPKTRAIVPVHYAGVGSVFHYIPLHSAPAGRKFGRFDGEDEFTTKESERLLRLPMWYGLTEENVDYVCECINDFYKA